jgi:leucyl/phenylalanyl-tRNA---protein transferase
MLRPDILLHAYSQGLFPMADPGARGRIGWYAPDPRAVVPLDDRFRVSRSLRRLVRQGTYSVTTDRAFEGVIRACAAPAPGRESTWISEEIEDAYTALHHLGFAHSVECWQGEDLVGGLYGVALRGAFFGESMFHTARDASKVALVHLVERLRAGGFVLLDTQFLTDHLARFGAYEVPRALYERQLSDALTVDADWFAPEGTARVPRA